MTTDLRAIGASQTWRGRTGTPDFTAVELFALLVSFAQISWRISQNAVRLPQDGSR